MQIKKVTAGIVAVTMAVGVFTGCGKVGSKTKAPANETFSAQIDMLNNTDLKDRGAIVMSIDLDNHESDTKATWDNLVEVMDNGSADFSGKLAFEWSGDKFSTDIDFADSKLVSLAYDGTDYYIDLSAAKTIMEKVGVWDESFSDKSQGFAFEDLLSMVKVPKTSLDSFTQQAEETAGADVDTEKLKNGLDPKVIEELKKLSEKAEYDGDTIVIKGLKMDDLRGVIDAANAQAQDIAGSDEIDLNETLGEEYDEVTVDYSLSFDEKNLDQTHTITMTDTDGNVVNISFTVKKPNGDMDFSKYSSAKTVEELTNNALTFESLAEYVMMFAAMGSDGSFE